MTDIEIQLAKIEKAKAAGFDKVVLYDADYSTIRELKKNYSIQLGFPTSDYFGRVQCEMGHLVNI